MAAVAAGDGRPLRMDELMDPEPLPNHKADVNNGGAFSTDDVGKSWDYPEAGYREQARIWQDRADYVAGFFCFLAQDPSVPNPLQKEINRWRSAEDDFPDTHHRRRQLYVREARRMVGYYVMTQKISRPR